MQPSGYMYLLNPENGNLVNAKTGKDVEIINWEDLVKDVKTIVIGIDGRLVYSPGIENAIIPFQEWLGKNHPDVELSLHSGPMDFERHLSKDVILEACAYGLHVSMTGPNSGKVGKMAKFIQLDDPEFTRELHLEVTKDDQGNVKSIVEVDKLREGKNMNDELLKSDHPLINQHFTAGISPGRFYMMGSHTGAAKSKLTKASEVLEHLTTCIELNGRALQVFIGFTDPLASKANANASKALAQAMPEIVGSEWVGVAKEQDADLGLVFDGKWWIITKCRGSMNGIVGNRLVTQALLDEACRNVNIKDAYPKTLAPVKPEQINAYDVDWSEATSGVLIIVDYQTHMGEGESTLNTDLLGRITDAIFSKNLDQYIMVKGDTDGDYETRLEHAIANVSCVVRIYDGEAVFIKFSGMPQLKDTIIH